MSRGADAMRPFPPGFGSVGGLHLGHNPLDVNAGVSTSHLRLAQERAAAQLAALAASASPKEKVKSAKSKEDADD